MASDVQHFSNCIRVLTIFVMAESQTIALQFVRPTNHGVLLCAITTFDSPNIVALSFNAVEKVTRKHLQWQYSADWHIGC